jgi:hypothetical protein
MIQTTFKKLAPLVLLLGLCIPLSASAHQPRIVTGRETVVVDPEISKAYYGQLTGAPDVFTITASAPFALYVNVLVPYKADQTKDVSVTVTREGAPVTVLDGPQFAWTKMFEQFGHDTYWQGPEYKAQAAAGTYVVTVSNPGNTSKYSLAIGEIEHFDFKEIRNTLTVVPQIKRTFFNESPIGFILSPFGWGLILMLYVLAGLAGLLYRFILRKMSQNTVRGVAQNIGTGDRVLRFAIGSALLVLAITTTWNVFLIFCSGFTIFEAVFSWCGFYAAIGKNTCPVE